MKADKILISSIVGTSAMTIFSYLVSAAENMNFREPELIGQLIKQFPISSSMETTQIAGWGVHYTIGFLFVAFYYELWKREIIKPSITSGALLGALSGLIGIVGWKIMFALHPNPPAKILAPFFGHLILAHIVFGIFSALTYKLSLAKKNQIIIKYT